MPGPMMEPQQPVGRHEPAQSTMDTELAIALPEWNLLPPAEFLDRHPRR
ncbi:hypothetical protein [Actinocrispum wychmicini]|uniref:Uncharacterized protein n=1 Tax=Actinocrispum wychmicini TaxID=1213861 RepID=A0A4R2JMB4_9PSEU|nr:hypothetical protein [Actinocrispum wychmicini]TCO59752.1 hypothetical protein EV192_104595 [Actinocrispum wychmicini]